MHPPHERDMAWKPGLQPCPAPTILAEKKPFWNVHTAKEAQLAIIDLDIVRSFAAYGNLAASSPASYIRSTDHRPGSGS
jgi:hypothetical protein